MTILFYSTAAVALLSALLAITRRNVMHSILYLIVVLLANAILFYLLGAPFLAALQVIIYAGAIIVLFLFVIMMINPPAEAQTKGLAYWLPWFGPLVLIAILGAEWFFLFPSQASLSTSSAIEAASLSEALFKDYFLTVQLVALLLFVGVIGAFHFARPTEPGTEPGEVSE